jgi:hypothetical protein
MGAVTKDGYDSFIIRDPASLKNRMMGQNILLEFQLTRENLRVFLKEDS